MGIIIRDHFDIDNMTLKDLDLFKEALRVIKEDFEKEGDMIMRLRPIEPAEALKLLLSDELYWKVYFDKDGEYRSANKFVWRFGEGDHGIDARQTQFFMREDSKNV